MNNQHVGRSSGRRTLPTATTSWEESHRGRRRWAKKSTYEEEATEGIHRSPFASVLLNACSNWASSTHPCQARKPTDWRRCTVPLCVAHCHSHGAQAGCSGVVTNSSQTRWKRVVGSSSSRTSTRKLWA